MRRGRSIAAGAVLATLVVAGAGVADVSRGGLSYKGCITGSPGSVPACSGDASGLGGVESTAVSPDSKWVYSVAREDDSIARFKRKPASGKLSFKGCLSGDSDTTNCDAIPSATAGGAHSGLDDVRSLVISRDGRWAYAVVAGAEDDALAAFKRSRAKGKLKFEGCLTGADESGPSGSGACEPIPSISGAGAESGFDHPKSLTLSPDGKSLYVAATLDAAITRFKVNRKTGEPIYKDCITGEDETGPSGSGACAVTPVTTSGGANSGLSDIRGLAVTHDGKWLYGVAADDDSVVRFARDTQNGGITFKSCLSGATNTALQCDTTATALVHGENSGLDTVRSFALSPDEKQAYVSSRADASVVRLARNSSSGKLKFKSCISGDTNTGAAGSGACETIDAANANTYGDNSGLGSPESVVASRDGRAVYVSVSHDAGVAIFRRADAGGLTFRGCISGELGLPNCTDISHATPTGSQSGLNFPQFMALSPDDGSLYVAAGNDEAVAVFKR